MPMSTPVIDISAVVIAGCALYLTWRQSRNSQEHNRLSVRPRLTSLRYTEELPNPIPEDGVSINTDVYFRYEIINAGLGPAVITKYQAHYDGVPIDTTNDRAITGKIDEILKGKRHVSDALIIKGDQYAMRPGDSKYFINVSWKPGSMSRQEIEDVLVQLRKFSLYVEYESMYGVKHNRTI